MQPKYYKVTATREQLESIGISYDITGLTGERINVFPMGWYIVKITHKIGYKIFTNEFGIHKSFLEEVNVIMDDVLDEDKISDEKKKKIIENWIDKPWYENKDHQ